MDIQMMVLIALSMMMVVAVAYLVIFKKPEKEYEHTSQGSHHDHWS